MSDPEKCNELLGADLGRRSDGHSIFAWKWSEDLFWPMVATGRKIMQRVEVPLIVPVPVVCPSCEGTGFDREWDEEGDAPAVCADCEGTRQVLKTSDVTSVVMPEYQRRRQVEQQSVWVMTKWMSPEHFIYGTDRPHGESRGTEIAHPTDVKLRSMWEKRFPGCEFPEHGWRVPCGVIGDNPQGKYVTLPRVPGGPAVPNYEDTRYFIACVREQSRLGLDERLRELLAKEDAINADTDREIGDMIRDSFPAFLNPVPGKRSNFVSMPWTKRDRMI